MEQLKALFDAIIAYCVNVPFHAVTLLVAVAFLLAVVVALVWVYAKDKGRTQPLPQPPAKAQERAPLPQPSVAETQRADFPAITPVDEPPGTQTEPEETVKEFLPSPTVTVRPLSPPKPKKHVAEQASDANIEKKHATEYKEGTMLLEELKDINTDLDFYEEDETDKMARYSGKWTICRVVTNDIQNLEMYFFELHSSNGEKLFSSEEYTNYNAAIRGIETHKSNILHDNFRLTQTKSGEYSYKLLNGKGMLLCIGDVYESAQQRERALELIKRFARTAFVDENVLDVVVKMPEESDAPLPPVPSGENGKWVIDSRETEKGEKVFFFELLDGAENCLLASEEYSSYVGAINSIQTHKTNIKNGNFRILLTKQGDYVYKLLNGNGQLLCMGEHFRTKRLCEYAIAVIKSYAVKAPVLTDPDLMNAD